jgi:hypothetical protein
MRYGALLFAALLGAGVLVGPESAEASESCSDDLRTLAAVAPGSSVAVRSECVPVGASIDVAGTVTAVPEPGSGVGVYQVAEHGAEPLPDVEIENDQGMVTVRRISVQEAPGPMASPSACSDTARAWSGRRNTNFAYYISIHGIPGNVTWNDFNSEIARAHATIAGGVNDCGLASGPSTLDTNLTRAGSTTRRAADGNGNCFADSYDVIDFGPLPAGTIGRSCVRWTVVPFADDRIYEADTRLRGLTYFYKYIPPSCYNGYEISGVLAHEFGHNFGMSHVDEATHGNLTMSTNATPCSYADGTLGRGDYDNLHVHY